MGFILTGVVGTMVTSWIQQRGWAWQNHVAKIESDPAAPTIIRTEAGIGYRFKEG